MGKFIYVVTLPECAKFVTMFDMTKDGGHIVRLTVVIITLDTHC